MLLALPLSPILFAGFPPAPPHPKPAAWPDVLPHVAHVALLYTSVLPRPFFYCVSLPPYLRPLFRPQRYCVP